MRIVCCCCCVPVARDTDVCYCVTALPRDTDVCYCVTALPRDKLRERLLDNHAFQNAALHMCCVPNEYAALHVIFMNMNGAIVSATLKKAIVTSCHCL
jgi:hypothetical protein